MRRPGWARFWTVDEAIECLAFGDDRPKVEAELLAACPNAYGGVVGGDGSEGTMEFPPEPDHPDRVARGLAAIWAKLSEDVQRALVDAAARDGID